MLEGYAGGESISKDELTLLELEIETQIENIKFSRSQDCTKEAPKNICKAARVCEGTSWIIFFSSILDKSYPHSLGTKSRESRLFDLLLENNHLNT